MGSWVQAWGWRWDSSSFVKFRMASAIAALVMCAQVSESFPCNHRVNDKQEWTSINLWGPPWAKQTEPALPFISTSPLSSSFFHMHTYTSTHTHYSRQSYLESKKWCCWPEMKKECPSATIELHLLCKSESRNLLQQHYESSWLTEAL